MIGLLKAKGQHQKGRRLTAAALSTFILASPLFITQAIPATPGNAGIDPIMTGHIEPQAVNHEIRQEFTKAGWEGVELAGRLHELGGLINRPITWTIKRPVVSGQRAGELILRQSASVINAPLDPGEYIIEAQYGFHKVTQAVSLDTGQRLAMTFILNVGGIRAMSKLDELATPLGIKAHHTIYALTGPQKGRQITAGAHQGKVLRLGAGTYRIESRMWPGNTITEHTVTVKPGILSSLELAHQAGLARITIGESLGTAVAWDIRNLNGSWHSGHTTPEAALVLAPGRYEVKAIVNGTVVREQFSISAGENRTVRIGYGS